MVSSFLSSVAQLLRKLVSEGRAVHCTEVDAVELELLAGLPWKDAPTYAAPRAGQDDWWRGIESADIAFGWLKMAGGTGKLWDGPHLVVDGGLLNEDARRIAVRAELALIAAHWQGCTAHDAGIWSGGCEEQSKRIWMAFPADAHQGTIEGARAAWGFVVDKLGEEIDTGPCSIRDLEVRHPMLAKYRRELEAMK